MKYSIIIPIFKEKKNLISLITKLTKELNSQKKIYEIIFVDDDSRDGSNKIFKKIKKKNVKFFIRKQKPRDLSKSVVYGFRKSNYENLAVMDGDLQHRPIDLIKLMNVYEIKKYDLVIGSRRMISYKTTNLNPIRFYVSRLLNFTTNLLFNYNLIDPMSGFL